MTKIAILNGHVLDPSQKMDGPLNLLIADGKIQKLTKDKNLSDPYQIIDAKGCVVTPGFIDLHTHLREPGFEYREDIESGSRSAVAGGFTTILCMANTQPVNDNASITEKIIHRAQEVGLCRVLPIGAVSKGLKGKELAEIGEMVHSGCVGISDDGMPVMSGELMRHALEYAKTFNVPVITHAEDLTLSHGGSMHEGEVSCRLGLKGIPAVAEESMIQRDLLLAGLTGHHLHVAHVSTARGIEMIARAKQDGIKVTCEVTPHHLVLTDSACEKHNTSAKVNPPLRTLADCEALIRALGLGVVDAIATDHAPHAEDEKTCGFDEANFGLIGMETALPVLLDLVQRKKLTLAQIVEHLTIKPATAFCLSGGTLREGAAADVTIFDPNASVTLDPSQFASKSRNTPFAGWKLKGKIRWTLFGGKIVYATV